MHAQAMSCAMKSVSNDVQTLACLGVIKGPGTPIILAVRAATHLEGCKVWHHVVAIEAHKRALVAHLVAVVGC